MSQQGDRESELRTLLGEIRDQVVETRADLRAIRTDQERHARTLEESHRVVTGGPDPRGGLVYQVSQLRDEAEEHRERTTFWLRTMGTGIITALLGAIAAAFEWRKS